MTWFAVYETVTGRLRSSGSVVADPLPEGLALKKFAERPTGFDWNEKTLDFDVPVPSPSRRVTALEFMELFTASERIAIRRAGDPILDDFLDMVRVAGTINLDSDVVQQGLGYLVKQGHVSEKRAVEIGGA